MVDIKQVGHVGCPIVSNARNDRKNIGIGHPEKDGADQEAQYSWDQIVKITPAKTGQAGARSETGQGHTRSKYQRADKIADQIGRGAAGQVGQPQVVQEVDTH